MSARLGPPVTTVPVGFEISTWCRLLAHRCDGVAGSCRCECHR
jgi:hypothetical protein